MLFLIPLFAAHLLVANVAAAGPLVCSWLDWREGRGDDLAGQAGRFTAAVALAAVLLSALLGLALGVVVWTPDFRLALLRLESRIQFGIWEWLFSLSLMAAHLVWWRRRPQLAWRWRILRITTAVVAGTNLLYHFPVLFAIVAKVAGGAVPGTDPIGRGDFRRLLVDGEVMSKSIHFWLAALAVSGLVLMLFAIRRERAGDAPQQCQRVVRWGAVLTLVPTILQIPIGIWLVTQLPAGTSHRLLGGDPWSALTLALSIGLVFPLFHALVLLLLNGGPRGKIIQAIVLVVVIVVLMTSVLHRSQSAPVVVSSHSSNTE